MRSHSLQHCSLAVQGALWTPCRACMGQSRLQITQSCLQYILVLLQDDEHLKPVKKCVTSDPNTGCSKGSVGCQPQSENPESKMLYNQKCLSIDMMPHVDNPIPANSFTCKTVGNILCEVTFRGLETCSAVKSTLCSPEELGFGSQHP